MQGASSAVWLGPTRFFQGQQKQRTYVVEALRETAPAAARAEEWGPTENELAEPKVRARTSTAANFMMVLVAF